MNYEKTINGLCYMGQSDLAEIIGVERHTINGWQQRHGLPVVKDDKYNLCCTPIYINWYFARAAFGDKKSFPKDNAALIVAIGQLSGGVSPTKTALLLQKGLGLPRQKALLVVGMAAEWVRVNLKPEHHVKI